VPWIWKTFWPKSGFSTDWTLTASTSATPASLRALRTSSTLASCASAVWIFVPDSKSIPKLSWLVANESAPMTRMTPEIEKKKHHSTSGHHPGFHKTMAEAGYAFPDLSTDGGPQSNLS